MSRTARLLELLITVQTKPHSMAAELAEESGAPRRKMLGDLGALSAMGVPLRAPRWVRGAGTPCHGAVGGSHLL